jgi:uncharacterized protein (DUF305 family)
MRSTYRIVVALAGALALFFTASFLTTAQDGTPATNLTSACDSAGQNVGTQEAMADMEMSTPEAMIDHTAMDLDQMYIDMMIPHHASIIAMAEAALPRLSDQRLQTIAKAIVAAQQPEIDELRGFRQDWYGDAAPMPMDGPMMETMAEMMPDISGAMDKMAFQMDAAAQVAAVCAADNPDLTFIDLAIPHHRMAIEASQAVLDHATHPELREFARRVVDAQQREVDELTAIRQELAGGATPVS